MQVEQIAHALRKKGEETILELSEHRVNTVGGAYISGPKKNNPHMLDQ